MQFTLVGYDEAHAYVDHTPAARWDGWNIHYFTPNPAAFFSKDGVYDRSTGRFGYIYVIRPNKDGQWRVRVNGYNRRTRS